VAAIRAAQLGMKVACVDKDASPGGTCLNVGCIPSKALLESSERYAAAKHELSRHGVNVGEVELDLAAMMKRKDAVVGALVKGVASLLEKNGVDHFTGTARLAGAGKVQVDGTTTLACARTLIATGSRPVELPALPLDGERIISSTEALRLTEVPARMLVVGAGAIGLEMGSVWSRLGSRVTVVELLDQIVPGSDREIAGVLQKVLARQGLAFSLETTARAAEVSPTGVNVTLEGADEQRVEQYDVVLVAVGRRPYSEALGLEEAGVALDERGRIRVDEDYRTSADGVFAIGDVIAGPMLAHKAEEEGVAAVEKMAGVAGHVNYATIPSVVYTWPELAWVGVSEEQARHKGGATAVRVGSFPFRASGRARCSGNTDGMVKIVAAADSDRVQGIHIVGPNASELIAEAAVAMEFCSSAEDIARSVHAHPTLAEAIKEAALAVDGRAIHI